MSINKTDDQRFQRQPVIDIQIIAEALAEGRHRFLTEMQIGAMRRKYGAARDEIRMAAVLADRIRRHRQLTEAPANFRVERIVDVAAPIALKSDGKPPRKPRKKLTAPERPQGPGCANAQA